MTILVATDGSEPAAQALEVAIQLARDTGAALEVLSVRQPRPVGRAGSGPAILETEEAHGAEHIAERAAEHAREAGIDATPHTGHGDVVDVIAESAGSLGADLLVVGSPDHQEVVPWWRGAVLGSVSHALVHRSPVPLTIVSHAAAKS